MDVMTHKLIYRDEEITIEPCSVPQTTLLLKQLDKQVRNCQWCDEWCSGRCCSSGTGRGADVMQGGCERLGGGVNISINQSSLSRPQNTVEDEESWGER